MQSSISESVLNWYDKFGRKNLPWKVDDPYKIWISEIMLQQTQVQTVIPYYLKFIKKYPNIKSLSKASLDDLLLIWSGLGYYTRIKNIHEASKIISDDYNGVFPESFDEILMLPGIGRTTASAISTFSGFSNRAILDGNVKRILVRFFNVNDTYAKSELDKILWKKSEFVTPSKRTSDFIQGLMDLGATVCKRTQPDCLICPIKKCGCLYKPETKQKKDIKKTIKKISALLTVIINQHNQVYLEKITTGKLWLGLFSSPTFNSQSLKNNWMLNNNLVHLDPLYESSFTHRVTNKIYHFNVQYYFLKNDKKVSLSTKNWYNLSDINVGLPRYLDKALTIYRSKHEKDNV
jgi:A/G-specific adenine glycosylase